MPSGKETIARVGRIGESEDGRGIFWFTTTNEPPGGEVFFIYNEGELKVGQKINTERAGVRDSDLS